MGFPLKCSGPVRRMDMMTIEEHRATVVRELFPYMK